MPTRTKQIYFRMFRRALASCGTPGIHAYPLSSSHPYVRTSHKHPPPHFWHTRSNKTHQNKHIDAHSPTLYRSWPPCEIPKRYSPHGPKGCNQSASSPYPVLTKPPSQFIYEIRTEAHTFQNEVKNGLFKITNGPNTSPSTPQPHEFCHLTRTQGRTEARWLHMQNMRVDVRTLLYEFNACELGVEGWIGGVVGEVFECVWVVWA